MLILQIRQAGTVLDVRKALNFAITPSPNFLDISFYTCGLFQVKFMFALLTKACGPSAPALTQVLWSWDMNDDPLSGPDGYSNGPGTGAVIAPPPYEGQQPSRIKDTNHGGSSYGAFTGDY